MNRNRKIKQNDESGAFSQFEAQTRILSYREEQEGRVISNAPLTTICESIQLLIQELYKRGYPIYDFDNKEKHVQGIRIIRDRVYFLAAGEAEHEAKKESGKI